MTLNSKSGREGPQAVGCCVKSIGQRCPCHACCPAVCKDGVCVLLVFICVIWSTNHEPNRRDIVPAKCKHNIAPILSCTHIHTRKYARLSIYSHTPATLAPLMSAGHVEIRGTMSWLSHPLSTHPQKLRMKMSRQMMNTCTC